MHLIVYGFFGEVISTLLFNLGVDKLVGFKKKKT